MKTSFIHPNLLKSLRTEMFHSLHFQSASSSFIFVQGLEKLISFIVKNKYKCTY